MKSIQQESLLKYIILRVLQAIFLTFSVVLVTFTLLRVIPGDPARLLILIPGGVSEEVLGAVRLELGLDKPFLEQLRIFLSNIVVGDFGTSFRYHKPVLPIVLSCFPNTLKLVFLSELLVIVLAIVLGISSARWKGSLIDRFSMILATFGQSVPMFWFGLMMMLLFSVHLGILPSIGYIGPKSFILPCITIAVATLPSQLLVTRSSMLDVINQDYIRTARSFGLSNWYIYYVYALKNASIPIISMMGIQLGYLLGGAIVAEVVFCYPGLGLLAINAMNARDFPLIQGITIITASFFIFLNLIVDIIYVFLDPRIRLKG